MNPIAEIQRAARGAVGAELHAAAVADGCRVPRKKFGKIVPLAELYADGAALLAAVLEGDERAVGAALRGLARRDGEAMLEVALALASTRGPLAHDARHALAHSRSDRALDALVAVLHPALADSVHPAATARLRDVLAATGMALFVPRPRPTVEEWDALSDDERRALDALQPAGPPRDDLKIASDVVRVLGARQDAESIELIVRLFETHPDDRLRVACAQALAASRDPRASAALDKRWADIDSTIASIAVRAAVFRDLSTAWDRFAAHAAIANANDEAIIAQLFYALHGGQTPRSLDPDPLVIELRFVDLAAQLRRHRTVGSWARRVLEVVSRDVAVAAIDRHPLRVAPAAPVPLPAARDFVARYRRGEYGVWDDLVGQAAAIAQHPDLRDEAYAVASEIMKRARHNIDAIRVTLREAGARVHAEDPRPDDAQLARVVELGGPLPIALEAFWRVVGSAVLVPDGYSYGPNTLEVDGISLLALDPLELHADVSYCLDTYAGEIADSHAEIVGPLALELSPDYLHKQDISGGPPHTIMLPAETPADAVDPPLRYTRYRARLVEYLRIAFRYGGFPGVDVAHLPLEQVGLNDRIAFKRVTGSWTDAADRLLARLRRDVIDL